MSAIWILGGAGRTGRAIAARVASAGLDVVLVGRDAARLEAAAGKLGRGVSTFVAADVPAIIRALSRDAPAVVINTVGPFAETAGPIASACPAGAHYVDLSNELSAAQATFALHDAAVAREQTLVTGAGFGVYATESVVMNLCKDRPAPERLRVDAIASVEAEPGRLGEALAATIVDVLAAGGRRYERGRLVRSRLLGDFETLSSRRQDRQDRQRRIGGTRSCSAGIRRAVCRRRVEPGTDRPGIAAAAATLADSPACSVASKPGQTPARRNRRQGAGVEEVGRAATFLGTRAGDVVWGRDERRLVADRRRHALHRRRSERSCNGPASREGADGRLHAGLAVRGRSRNAHGSGVRQMMIRS